MPDSRPILTTSLLTLLASAPAAAQLGQDLPDGTQPAQWRVIWHEDPAHEAIVAWTTDDEGASVLRYDTASRGGDRAAYTQQVQCQSERHTLSLDYFHHCQMSGLQPSTRYYFVLETDGDLSQELYFVTAPADPNATFKLLFGGDSRSDSSRRRTINAAMAGLVADDPSIIALAHGGDYIERGTSWSQWKQWLSDHELTTGADGRVLPVIPTRGNHEAVGALYDEIWASPGGEGNYFTTTIGRFVLVTLNTETTQSGDQRDWLEAQLQDAVTHARWVTAQYHRPAWPAVKQPGGALQHWVPLFEAYDVDMVFESDGHVLKRTVPIRNDAQDPTGVVYVGEGGLGVGQRTPDTTRWFLQAPGFAAAAHHVQRVTVAPDALTYEALAPDGTSLDTYAATPRDRGQTPPPPPDAGVPDTGEAPPPEDAGVGAPDAAPAPDATEPAPAPDAGPAPAPPVDAGAPPAQADASGCTCMRTGAGVAPGLVLLSIIGLVMLRRRRLS